MFSSLPARHNLSSDCLCALVLAERRQVQSKTTKIPLQDGAGPDTN
jgi:hypothetical protein